MRWKVTYRNEHGIHAHDLIDSENRDSLFKLLADRGINAIKIEQATEKDICSKCHKKIKSIIAAILTLVIVVTTIIIFSAKDNNPTQKITKTSRRATTPAIISRMTNEVEKIVKKENISLKKDRPSEIGEVVNGYVMLPSGRIHRRVGVVTNSIANRPKGKYAIFTRSCNNEIACYLTLKPGALIFGNIQHDGRFTKDFLESLEEPIVITEEDSEKEAQLKRDVIEARLFLKDALDRGEDIEKIMQQTRSELQDLMRVRINYEKLFREQLKDCDTEQEVDDLFRACNKMLEDKGIAPLTYGPITKKNLLRQKANKEF